MITTCRPKSSGSIKVLQLELKKKKLDLKEVKKKKREYEALFHNMHEILN